ncbi:hypothetical protein BX600DRAFT_247249 [Xylariales sp. PMI_506]|nr:hypothetical protein BX600DRAFT_247249 [Xylariales sp. PMI_506]
MILHASRSAKLSKNYQSKSLQAWTSLSSDFIIYRCHCFFLCAPGVWATSTFRKGGLGEGRLGQPLQSTVPLGNAKSKPLAFPSIHPSGGDVFFFFCPLATRHHSWHGPRGTENKPCPVHISVRCPHVMWLRVAFLGRFACSEPTDLLGAAYPQCYQWQQFHRPRRQIDTTAIPEAQLTVVVCALPRLLRLRLNRSSRESNWFALCHPSLLLFASAIFILRPLDLRIAGPQALVLLLLSSTRWPL